LDCGRPAHEDKRATRSSLSTAALRPKLVSCPFHANILPLERTASAGFQLARINWQVGVSGKFGKLQGVIFP